MKSINRPVNRAIAFTVISMCLAVTAMGQNQRTYRNSDRQMRSLLTRIETATDRFSNLLPNALDRSRIDGTAREDNVNELVTNFERATDLLKERFDRRQSTQADAQTVLQEGQRINQFMGNHRLDTRTQNSWTQVRTALNQLATAYNVAWNWNTPPVYGTGGGYGNAAGLTGTYRLNASASTDPRTVAESATRGLPANQRERVFNNLVTRLTPPDMMAINRTGTSVTMASSASPQATFDADGRTRTETYPNGRTSQVRATLSGEKLTVVTNGDRANDFTVTIASLDRGRRLLVTREMYAERLQRPVRVESYYDRTDQVARWDIYNANGSYPTTSTAGNFVIPNGTQVVAVLNNDLSTRNTREGDKFTLTVRSPSQYNGAVIEGHVSQIDRGGRITGRSEMTLDFDTIRLRNGRSYEFAGLVEGIVAVNGEGARVDNEGAVQEEDNRTNTTLGRTAIGTAVGAIIGAIAGGGTGAAIGAAVGAGAGAGSVYVQGRDELNLSNGTELTIRASAPGNVTGR